MLKNNTGDYVWFDSELFIKWRNWWQLTQITIFFHLTLTLPIVDRGVWSPLYSVPPPPPFWYPPFWNFQDDHYNLPKNMPIKHANLQGKNIRIFLKHTDLLKMKFLQKKKKILRADRGYFRNWRQHPAEI